MRIDPAVGRKSKRRPKKGSRQMNSPALQVSGSARTTADRLHKNANPTMKDQSLYCGGKPSNRPEKIESIPATIRAVPTEIPSVDSHSTNTELFSALIKLPAFTAFNSPLNHLTSMRG